MASDEKEDSCSSPPSAASALSPQQIRQALRLVGYLPAEADPTESGAAFLQQFIQTWGQLTMKTLVHIALENQPGSISILTSPHDESEHSVAAHAPGFEPVTDREMDVRFALMALGLTQTTVARAALAPYLKSERVYERWISALWLGRLHDERALPVLGTMLTEFLPGQLPQRPNGTPVLFFEEWRETVAEVLWRWGTPACVPALRRALMLSVEAEQQTLARSGNTIQTGTFQGEWQKNSDQSAYPVYAEHAEEHRYYERLVEWVRFEHRLVYGIGRVSAFGALVGCETPTSVYHLVGSWQWDQRHPEGALPNADANAHRERFRSNVWRVEACCGCLEPVFLQHYGSQWITTFQDAPIFAQAVEHLLEAQFGLGETARAEASHDYEDAGCLTYMAQYCHWKAKESLSEVPDRDYATGPGAFWR